MADKSTIQWHKFFDPSTKYKGQVSSVDPLVVPPGGYQVAKNVRGQNGVPTTRGHITALTPSGLVTGTYKGHSVVFLNDVEYMVVAIRESSTTKVYIASNTGASPTFTEITGIADVYPDTRFALDGNVCFSVVRNPLNSGDAFAGYDMLVFSNGYETMLYNPFGSTCLPIVAPYAPGDSVIKQSVGFPYYLNMSVANVTVTASDADVTVADNQAHPTTSGTTPYASFGTAVETDGTDWAKFAFASGADVCAGKDLVFVYDTVDFADPWSCLKVQVSADDSTYYTVYTPGTDPLPPVVDCSKSFLQVAFKLDPTVISVGLDMGSRTRSCRSRLDLYDGCHGRRLHARGLDARSFVRQLHLARAGVRCRGQTGQEHQNDGVPGRPQRRPGGRQQPDALCVLSGLQGPDTGVSQYRKSVPGDLRDAV